MLKQKEMEKKIMDKIKELKKKKVLFQDQN
jgi:hypothetical protein